MIWGLFQKVPSWEGAIDAMQVLLAFLSWSIVSLLMPLLCSAASFLKQLVAFWDAAVKQQHTLVNQLLCKLALCLEIGLLE